MSAEAKHDFEELKSEAAEQIKDILHRLSVETNSFVAVEPVYVDPIVAFGRARLLKVNIDLTPMQEQV